MRLLLLSHSDYHADCCVLVGQDNMRIQVSCLDERTAWGASWYLGWYSLVHFVSSLLTCDLLTSLPVWSRLKLSSLIKNGDDLLPGDRIKGFNTLEEAQRRWGERFSISHSINTHLRLGFGGLHGKNVNMHPVLQHSVQFTHSFQCFCYTYLEM